MDAHGGNAARGGHLTAVGEHLSASARPDHGAGRVQDGALCRRLCDLVSRVILCREAEEAEEALRRVTAWTTANGLTLHPDKTRMGDAREPGQGFEFLGYRFEGGRRYVRKKSLQAFKDKVRVKTGRTRGDSLDRIIGDLNPMLRGWFAYFRAATRSRSAPSTALSADGYAQSCAS